MWPRPYKDEQKTPLFWEESLLRQLWHARRVKLCSSSSFALFFVLVTSLTALPISHFGIARELFNIYIVQSTVLSSTGSVSHRVS